MIIYFKKPIILKFCNASLKLKLISEQWDAFLYLIFTKLLIKQDDMIQHYYNLIIFNI